MLEKLAINDLDLIFAIEEDFSETYPSGSIINDFTQNPFTNYIYIKENNQVVAIMNYTLIYDRIELNQINVQTKYQNKKYATTLLKYLINEAEKQKLKNITLEVKQTNEIAIHLYEKHGFKTVSVRKNYYDKVDGLLMEKEMIK